QDHLRRRLPIRPGGAPMSRIWLRIFISYVVVLVVAVGTVSLYLYWSTQQEFATYVERARVAREARISASLANFYDERATWNGVQPVAVRLSQFADERVIVVDTQDYVVGDSNGDLVGRTIVVPPTDHWTDIADGDQVYGRVFVGRPGIVARFNPRDSAF